MSKIKLHILPDEDDFESAEVHVFATVEGDEFEFLLDTGAGTSSIRNSEFTMHYPVMYVKKSAGVFAQHADDLIKIPSFKLGPILQTGVEFYRIDGEVGMTNLIGMNIMKDYAFYFDFKNNTMEINPDSTRYAKDSHEIILDEKYHPYIPVKFKDEEVLAVWDTGASITVVDHGFIAQHAAHFKLVGESTGTDSTGESMQTPLYEMKGIGIDGHLFPTHHVAGVDLTLINSTVDTKMNLILGYSTLRHADWWFNFPGKKWRITKFRG